MKKILAGLLLAVGFGFPRALFAEQSVRDANPSDIRYERASQETTRYKELLEIWKEHVKTLTKERDEYAKEVEMLKAIQPQPVAVAQFAGIETQPLPSGETLRTLEGLRSQVDTLQTQLKKTQTTSTQSQGLQSRIGSLESQNQRLEKELAETRSGKEAVIRSREEALKQVNTLTGEIKDLRAQVEELRSSQSQLAQNQSQREQSYQGLRKDYDAQAGRLSAALREKEEAVGKVQNLQQRIVALESETRSLRTATQEPSGDEKSLIALLAQRNQDFERIRDLEAKLGALQNDTDALRGESQSDKQRADLNAEYQEALGQIRDLKAQNEALRSKGDRSTTVAKETEERRNYYESTIKGLQADNKNLLSYNESLQKSLAELAASSKAQETKLADIRAVQIENERMKSAVLRVSQLETEKGSLRKMVSDLSERTRRQETDLENAMKKTEELKKQNETLSLALEKSRHQADEYKSASGRLQSQLAAAEADRQKSKTTEEKLQKTLEENKSLAAMLKAELQKAELSAEKAKAAEQELQKAQSWGDALKKSYGALEEDYRSQEQSLKTLYAEKEISQKQIDENRSVISGLQSQLAASESRLQSQLAAAETDRQNIKAAEQQLQKVLQDNDALKKAYIDLENRQKAQTDKVQELSLQAEEFRRSNEELRASQSQLLKTVEQLRSDLRTDFSDIQNLKSNFESYLESLVAGFKERQK